MAEPIKPQMTVDEFAAKYKAANPGTNAIPNTTLVQQVLDQYPQYRARVANPPASMSPAGPLNPNAQDIVNKYKAQYPQFQHMSDEHLATQLAIQYPRLKLRMQPPATEAYTGTQIPSGLQGPMPAGVTRAHTPYEGKDVLLKPGEVQKGAEVNQPGPKAPSMLEQVEDKILKPLQTPIPGAAWGMAGLYLPAKELAKVGEAISPKASPAAQAFAGAAQAPKAMIESMTTPENVITLVGLAALPEGTLFKKLVSAGFTAQQATNAVSQWREAFDAYRKGNYRTAGFMFASAPMSTLFTILGADTLVRDLQIPKGEAAPTKVRVKGKVLSKTPLTPEVSDEHLSQAVEISKDELRQNNQAIQQGLVKPEVRVELEKRNEQLRDDISFYGGELAKRRASAPSVPAPKVTSTPMVPRTSETQKPAFLGEPTKAAPKTVTPKQEVEQLRAEQQSKAIAAPKPAETTKLTPIQTPAEPAYQLDAETANKLVGILAEHPRQPGLTSSGLEAAKTNLAKLNHALDREGPGRVAELSDLQRGRLEQERVKAQREVRFQLHQAARELSPTERAKWLVQYSQEAETKTAMGRALLAAAKEKEQAPPWLETYVESLRTNNPSLRKQTLTKKLGELRAGAMTPEDEHAIDQVDRYMSTMYEAEAKLGKPIPLSTQTEYLAKLGKKFSREGEQAQKVANALRNRLGAKREKVAIGKAEPAIVAPPVPEVVKPKVPVLSEADKAALRATGYDKDQIARLTPEGVARALGRVKPTESLKTVPVEAPKERVVPKKAAKPEEPPTVEEEEKAAALSPVSRQGGAVSIEGYEEILAAKQATPEEEALQAEEARKNEALAKNLERPSLRDAFKADMLQAVEKAKGNKEVAEKLIDNTPIEKLLSLPWPKEVKGVIERYAVNAAPAKVPRITELVHGELSPKAQEWLAAADFLESRIPNAGEYNAIREAIPTRFTPEEKLERYAKVLQKYIELDENGDVKALAKAVRAAARDTEKGAVHIAPASLDALTIYKKAQKLGKNVSFTHSSPLYPASWILGEGVDQIQIEVGTWDSHAQVANEIEGNKGLTREQFNKLSGAARAAALKKWNQPLYDWLDKRAIRKASVNSYQVAKITPESVSTVWDLFRRSYHKLSQTEADPVLFIELSRNLKGELSDNMSVSLSYNQVQDKFAGDPLKAALAQLGQLKPENYPTLYAGIPIPHLIHGLKNVGKALLQLGRDWSMSDLDGQHVSTGFLKRRVTESYYGQVAQASINEVQGQINHETAMLHNQLNDDMKRWDSVPAAQLEAKVREFYKAHAGQIPFTNPDDQILSNTLKAHTDHIYNQLVAAGQDVHYLQNYFPGIWENRNAAQKLVQSWVGGKGLFDSRGKRFFMPKKYINFDDAINAGLIPKSWNPVKQWLTYMESMSRFLVNHSTQNFWKGLGLMKFAKGGNVRNLPPMPEGLEWTEIKHPSMQATYRTAKGERVLAGKWFAIKPFAEASNKFMQPGWNKSIIYHGVQMYSNYFNLFKLGISGMHGMMTMMNNFVWTMHHAAANLTDAYRMGQFHPENILRAVSRGITASSFIGPSILMPLRGLQVEQEYLKPGTHPELTPVVNKMINQNIPFKWPTYYAQPDIEKFFGNLEKMAMSKPLSWEGLKYGSKAAAHFLPMIFRYMAKPLMDYFVPLSKLGSDAIAMERELWLESINHPRTFTPEQRMIRAMQIAHAHDESFGEMQLDNRNWSRWVKEMLKVTFLSGSWTSGTYLLFKEGTLDFAKEPFKASKGYGFELPPRTGYLIAATLGLAYISSILQLWMTGKSPQGKDFFAPQAPGKDAEGNQNRVWIKSYLNDVVNFAYDPVRTMTNKLSGPIHEVVDLLNNRDWDGYQIYNPQEAPISIKNLGYITYWAFMNKAPISFTNLSRERGLHAGIPAQIGAFFGVQPAPLHVRNDAFENRIYSVLQTQFSLGPRTFEQKAAAEKFKPLEIARAENKLPDAEIYRLVQNGTISPEQGKKLWSRSKTNFLQANFTKLTLPQMLWAWDVATKDEKAAMGPALAKKAASLEGWALNQNATLKEADVEVASLQKKLLTALADQPQEQIAAQLYLAAGKDRLHLAAQHFMQQKPIGSVPGEPRVGQLVHVKFEGKASPTANIALENALNASDLRAKNALQRGDKHAMEVEGIRRNAILQAWWQRQLKENPRTIYMPKGAF